MRETFGLPYTQDETYYVMDTSPGASVFLGLRDDADVEAFRHDGRAGRCAGGGRSTPSDTCRRNRPSSTAST